MVAQKVTNEMMKAELARFLKVHPTLDVMNEVDRKMYRRFSAYASRDGMSFKELIESLGHQYNSRETMLKKMPQKTLAKYKKRLDSIVTRHGSTDKLMSNDKKLYHDLRMFADRHGVTLQAVIKECGYTYTTRDEKIEEKNKANGIASLQISEAKITDLKYQKYCAKYRKQILDFMKKSKTDNIDDLNKTNTRLYNKLTQFATKHGMSTGDLIRSLGFMNYQAKYRPFNSEKVVEVTPEKLAHVNSEIVRIRCRAKLKDHIATFGNAENIRENDPKLANLLQKYGNGLGMSFKQFIAHLQEEPKLAQATKKLSNVSIYIDINGNVNESITSDEVFIKSKADAGEDKGQKQGREPGMDFKKNWDDLKELLTGFEQFTKNRGVSERVQQMSSFMKEKTLYLMWSLEYKQFKQHLKETDTEAYNQLVQDEEALEKKKLSGKPNIRKSFVKEIRRHDEEIERT